MIETSKLVQKRQENENKDSLLNGSLSNSPKRNDKQAKEKIIESSDNPRKTNKSRTNRSWWHFWR
ncbi:hypothetical protein [Pediococcus damnosus]|uniref:hypothetical protein n=1 Tax=Pediococcus damnosus TaxID=51663 RepID=UPI001F357737|nr:hypothetical protein [Pediococcus damnosus]